MENNLVSGFIKQEIEELLISFSLLNPDVVKKFLILLLLLLLFLFARIVIPSKSSFLDAILVKTKYMIKVTQLVKTCRYLTLKC